MSNVRNQVLTESRATHAHTQIAQEADEESHERGAANDAGLIERRLRADRDDVTASAVLGYN